MAGRLWGSIESTLDGEVGALSWASVMRIGSWWVYLCLLGRASGHGHPSPRCCCCCCCSVEETTAHHRCCRSFCSVEDHYVDEHSVKERRPLCRRQSCRRPRCRSLLCERATAQHSHITFALTRDPCVLCCCVRCHLFQLQPKFCTVFTALKMLSHLHCTASYALRGLL